MSFGGDIAEQPYSFSVKLSASHAHRPDDVYTVVAKCIGGNPGRAVVVHEQDRFTMEFTQLLCDQNGVVCSALHPSQGASAGALDRELFQQGVSDVHMPPVRSFEDKMAVAHAWNGYFRNIAGPCFVWADKNRKCIAQEERGLDPR